MGVLALEEEGCCFLSHSVHYVVEPYHVQDREKGTESLLEEILLRCLSSTSCLLNPLLFVVVVVFCQYQAWRGLVDQTGQRCPWATFSGLAVNIQTHLHVLTSSLRVLAVHLNITFTPSPTL